MFRSEGKKIEKNVRVNKESENTTKRMLCEEYIRMIPDSRKPYPYDSRTSRSVQINTKRSNLPFRTAKFYSTHSTSLMFMQMKIYQK